MAAIAALVDPVTSIVVNMIVADPAIDPAPDDVLMLGVAEGHDCGIGWTFDAATGAFSPPVE